MGHYDWSKFWDNTSYDVATMLAGWAGSLILVALWMLFFMLSTSNDNTNPSEKAVKNTFFESDSLEAAGVLLMFIAGAMLLIHFLGAAIGLGLNTKAAGCCLAIVGLLMAQYKVHNSKWK